MQYVSQEQIIQDLAVLTKQFTGDTVPYDRTIEILRSLDADAPAPRDVSARLSRLAMTVDRPMYDALKKSVGAVQDKDVRFFDATAGYLLQIAKVLYHSPHDHHPK